MLLTLAWLFIAATMNSTRHIRAVVAEFERNPGRSVRAGFESEIRMLERNSRLYSEYGGVYSRWIDQARQRQRQMGARYPEYESWSDVWLCWPHERQIGSLWAGVVWLGSAVGLGWFFALRLGRASECMVRALKALTLALFAVYAGWLVWLFAREMWRT